MKKLIMVLIIMSFGINFLKAQDESVTGELIIYVINNTGGANIKIEVDLISPLCWDAWQGYPDLHDITNLYPGSYLITNLNNKDLNWEACWSYPGYQHGFGLGNYRVTAYQEIYGEYEEQDYFEIDYRTSDLPENFSSGGNGDLAVDYNVVTGVFYYRNTQNYFPTITTIWEQKPWIDSITTELEPLPPDNFDLSTSGGHPYLTWNHSSNTADYWTGYAVYRCIVSGCGSSAASFSKIAASLSKQTTNYTDDDYTVSGPMTAHYKITAINGERESDYTETLDICVGIYKESFSNEIRYEYSLSQNYPNPFNPITNIPFSLGDHSLVTLKVYDILGREVDVLVNAYLASGNYSVKFDGSTLESGIYFYEIRTKNFRDVKKLILLK